MPSSLGHRESRKTWLAIVLAAIVVHLLFFVSFKPSFFSLFHKEISSEEPGANQPAFSPDAIVTLRIEVENAEKKATGKSKPQPVPANPSPSPPRTGLSRSAEEVVGSAPTTLPPSGSTPGAVLPPSPLEVVWPDTRGLASCSGKSVELKVRVGVDGRVLEVLAARGGYEPKCLQAALAAARSMLFSPGCVNGKAEEMWTSIRIDFRPR